MVFQSCFAFLMIIIFLTSKCTYIGLYFNSVGDGAQLDFDALCDNNDTAIAAFMNYLEAEGGLGDPGDFSDIHWTLQHLLFNSKNEKRFYILFTKNCIFYSPVSILFLSFIPINSLPIFIDWYLTFIKVWGNVMFSFKQSCSEFPVDSFAQRTGFKPTSCYFLLKYF